MAEESSQIEQCVTLLVCLGVGFFEVIFSDRVEIGSDQVKKCSTTSTYVLVESDICPEKRQASSMIEWCEK
jgi:hypothetical protein